MTRKEAAIQFYKRSAEVLYSGVLASLTRLGYQIPEANKPNQTIIIMILSELKYAISLQSRRTPLHHPC